MYKTVFQNSKAALLFAGLTIIGAVSMVGSPEDKGVLDRAVDIFAAQRETVSNDAQVYAETQSVPDTPAASPGEGWGGGASVFGEFAPGDSAVGPAVPASGGNQTALIPGPQPVVADNVGIPVPGPGNPDRQRSGPPVITAREVAITPN